MSRREERTLLDTVRWISAFMVGLGHALGLVYVRDTSLLSRAIWYVAEMRHAWVVIFFVLSGYLVGGNFLNRLPKFDPKQYFVSRFTRIYIVLIPALIMVVMIDRLAWQIGPHNPVYAPWPNGVLGDTAIFARYTLGNVLASVLSLENVIGEAMGSAGALWSLGFEWVFYFAFPAIVLLADFVAKQVRAPVVPARIAFLALSLVPLVALHKIYPAAFWLIWIAGAASHAIVETDRLPNILRWAGAALSIAGLLAAPLINNRITDPMIGFGFATFLAKFPVGERGAWLPLDKRLAAFSYSFYVVHLPLLAFVLLCAWKLGLAPVGGFHTLLPALALLAVMMATAVIVAFGFGAAFENRTDAFRRFLIGRFQRPSAVATIESEHR